MKKPSFFEKLSGAIRLEETENTPATNRGAAAKGKNTDWMEEESDEGQLAVDVHQTPTQIIIKAIVAGIRPEDLDVSITRDMVTIKGKREESHEVADDDYFCKELYWGSFSRSILLPQEIEPDLSEAVSRHGLLTINLPKSDRGKQTKVKVKA
jgi:HSP20 family protein